MELQSLTLQEKLDLLAFASAFAWADLEIQQQEKRIYMALVDEMGLAGNEREIALSLLSSPPRAEQIDPMSIPVEHRTLFLSTAHNIILADNELKATEASLLDLLRSLLFVEGVR